MEEKPKIAKQKVFFIACFLIIFCIPVLSGDWIQIFFNNPETRTIINLAKNKSEINQNYEKSLFFRKELTILNNTIRLNVLKERIFSDVLIGNNGWLYYSGESNLEDYQKTRKFNKTEIEEIKKQIRTTTNWMSKNNIKFYIVIAPNKETIQPEHLPEFIKVAGTENRLDQIKRIIDQDINKTIIDISVKLLEESKKEDLYYLTDTHWNSIGALIGYQTTFGKINQDGMEFRIKNLEDFYLEEEIVRGDLSNLLPLYSTLEEKSITLIPKEKIRATGYDTDVSNISISEIDDSSLKKAIIFHDSFMNGMMPYFSENFKKCVYVHQFKIDYDLIEREKPDIVIVEIAERYLEKLLTINE